MQCIHRYYACVLESTYLHSIISIEFLQNTQNCIVCAGLLNIAIQCMQPRAYIYTYCRYYTCTLYIVYMNIVHSQILFTTFFKSVIHANILYIHILYIACAFIFFYKRGMAFFCNIHMIMYVRLHILSVHGH